MEVSCPVCEHNFLYDEEGGRPAVCAECGYRFHPDAIINSEQLNRMSDTYRPRPLPDSGVVPGQRMGRYEIIDEIGRGGMSVVCKARDVSSGKFVALKLLPPRMHSSRDHVRAFLREAETVQRIRHPGIAQVQEIGCRGGRYFLAMEFVDGIPLNQAITRGRLLPEEAARIVAEAARATGTAHQAGILHRDLKPKNIMVTPAGRTVVLDFGLSAFYDQPEENDGRIVGTPAYISPEQARVERSSPLTPATDVYSLGAVLYESVTGVPPYSGVDSPTIVARVLQGPPPPPRTFSPGLNPGLEGIILKAMAREPGDRYESASALAEDLDRFRMGSTVLARKPGLSVQFRSDIWKTRRRYGKWVFPVLCVLLGLAVLAWVILFMLLQHT